MFCFFFFFSGHHDTTKLPALQYHPNDASEGDVRSSVTTVGTVCITLQDILFEQNTSLFIFCYNVNVFCGKDIDQGYCSVFCCLLRLFMLEIIFCRLLTHCLASSSELAMRSRFLRRPLKMMEKQRPSTCSSVYFFKPSDCRPGLTAEMSSRETEQIKVHTCDSRIDCGAIYGYFGFYDTETHAACLTQLKSSAGRILCCEASQTTACLANIISLFAGTTLQVSGLFLSFPNGCQMHVIVRGFIHERSDCACMRAVYRCDPRENKTRAIPHHKTTPINTPTEHIS